MREPLPLATIHDAVLEFLRGRDDVVVFGATAVNAYVDEPRMTQDIDLMSTRAAELAEELREIRLHGGHRGISDRVEGLNAVSAPIFDVNGVVGALTVSGPSHRWTDARMAQCYPQLMSIAQHISAELGSQSPRAASQHDRTSLVANKRPGNEAGTTSG